MLPSLYSGISGLQTHQQKMNVIGNDIANVNTTGYKQSDVTFMEAYVKTLRAASPGMAGQQVGLGVQMANITRDFSGGVLLQTGASSNLGISGNGFFVVSPAGSTTQRYYSRAGDFTIDTQGTNSYLINAEGRRLQGLMAANVGDPAPDLTGVAVTALTDIVLPENTTAYSVALDGTVYASISGADPQVIGRVAIADFANPNGLQATGSNLYVETDAAGLRTLANPGQSGRGQVMQGYLENSNVDLAREFTDMIVTQRGFQANSRTITTSDEMLNELLALKR